MAATQALPRMFGIQNCDTVKKARAWCQAQARPMPFHDFGKEGVPVERLEAWIARVGWERLLNRKGTTWRRLDDTTRSGVVDADGARAVMLAHPSAIKRPVVEWADGTITVGFDADEWSRR